VDSGYSAGRCGVADSGPTIVPGSDQMDSNQFKCSFFERR
jgi:hypothetical protein